LPNVYIKEMLENNDENKVYNILESHLISKKSVEILLINPFSKEDYYDFIAERERTVKSYIKENIISDKINLPPQYKDINDKIEDVELKIRNLIANKVTSELYNEIIPPAILDKVARRIENTMKKNPSLTREDFFESRKKLDYFDLQEYCDFFVSSKGWELYEDIFRSKPQLMDKFSKLGELRNSIRHSRAIHEVTELEGKAAIIWFNEAMTIK
jgi:hypothetical protein